MASNELTIHYKISLPECAKSTMYRQPAGYFQNIKDKRTRYYQILDQFLKYGLEGLYPRSRIPRCPTR